MAGPTLWLALCLSGCGGEPQAPAPAPAPPAAAASAAPLSSAAVKVLRAELAGLSLPELAAPSPATPTEEARPNAPKASFQGPAPRPLAESARRLKQTTPRAALGSTLGALQARDTAALARLIRGPGSSLTEDDALEVRQRFLSLAGRSYWARVATALRAGKFQIEVRASEAWVSVSVGGAAGTYRIRMKKEGGTWFLA